MPVPPAPRREGRPGAKGEPGAKGDPGEKGEPGADGAPAKVIYTAKRAPLNLPTGGAELTVLSLESLPPGTYLLTGHLTAVNFGTPGYVRCGIRGADANSYGNWGTPATVGGSGPAAITGQIYMSVPVTSNHTFTPELFCHQDSSTTAYVEESRLMAMTVGETDVRGDK